MLSLKGGIFCIYPLKMVDMNKKINQWLVLILLFSCGGQACKDSSGTAIPVIDITGNKQPEVEIKLSELAKDIRILPLETKEEALFSDRFSSWIGDKYLLLVTSDALFQFDTNGKYIRTLGTQGRGPGEFFRIEAITVDEEKDRVYYIDRAKRGIWGYDLKSGEALKGIESEFAYGEFLYMPKEEVLSGVALNGVPSRYRAFKITTDGLLLDTLRKAKFEIFDLTASLNPSHLVLLKDGIHYHLSDSDTLFVLQDNKIRPYCTWQWEEKTKSAEGFTEGILTGVAYENDRLLCLRKVKWNKYTNENQVKITTDILGKYVVDKKDWQVKQWMHVWLDPLKLELPDIGELKVCGKKLCMVWSAMEFKEAVKGQLNELAPGIKEAYARLTDDSNPVMLIATPL